MIQRIQSLYLFLALILVGMIFFFPLAHIVLPDNGIIYFTFKGLDINEMNVSMDATTSYPLIILLSIILLVLLITLFFYKNRLKQMRLCVFNIVLMLGLVFLMWFYSYYFSKTLNATIYYKYPFIFPFIAIVLVFLAAKGIKNDEELVRSADRLR